MTPQEARRILGDKTKEKVRSALAQGPATYPQIGRMTGLSFSTVQRCVHWLRDTRQPEYANFVPMQGKPKPRKEPAPEKPKPEEIVTDPQTIVDMGIKTRTPLERAWAGEQL